MDKAVQVSAYLDASVFKLLEKVAKEEDRSVSWLVGLAVKQLIASRKSAPTIPGAMRQVDIEEAIAGASKKKTAKHK